MGLKARILKVVALEGGGPRSKNVLKSLARTPLQVDQFDQIFDAMLGAGELVKYGGKGKSDTVRRQAVYGPPWLTRRRGEWVELATVPHAFRDDGRNDCLVCGEGLLQRIHQGGL